MAEILGFKDCRLFGSIYSGVGDSFAMSMREQRNMDELNLG